MGKSDWTKTKKRDSSHWEPVRLYAWKVDHGNDLSNTMYVVAVSDGPTSLAPNFYWFGEGVW